MPRYTGLQVLASFVLASFMSHSAYGWLVGSLHGMPIVGFFHGLVKDYSGHSNLHLG